MLRPGGTATPSCRWRERAGFSGLDVLDLLAGFTDRYAAFPVPLVTARARGLAAIQVLLNRYGVKDPTCGRAAGVFGGLVTRADNRRLRASGSGSRTAALEVAARL